MHIHLETAFCPRADRPRPYPALDSTVVRTRYSYPIEDRKKNSRNYGLAAEVSEVCLTPAEIRSPRKVRLLES
jgi:hypothetical protein